MLKPIHLRLFEKEVAKAKKRGKDIEKLKEVMRFLIQEEPQDGYGLKVFPTPYKAVSPG